MPLQPPFYILLLQLWLWVAFTIICAFSFSLTVVDSDGASNSTTANLTVNKAVDYPPVANAGPNQVITLPQNSITLYGNQSTDDHSIVSYEWLLSPNSKGKVMEMQVSAGLLSHLWLLVSCFGFFSYDQAVFKWLIANLPFKLTE